MDFPFRRSRKGKSGVDVRHAIQLLASQYSFDSRKAALIELVANALDARATRIEVNWNEGERTLEVIDNGCGMGRDQFERYHDLATSGKSWGEGIGFAGQGVKIALNFCNKVVTETFSDAYKGWSEWWLEGNDAPWKIQDGKTRGLRHQGTRVTLFLDRSGKVFSEELIKEALAEHYAPLLDKHLLKVYTGETPPPFLRKAALQLAQPIYGKGLRFVVNGEVLLVPSSVEELDDFKVVSFTLRRRFKITGYFGLVRDCSGVQEAGVSICTYGKVVERSWFKKEPQDKGRIVGWMEAPVLIRAVTTDKCRFQKGNPLWESFFRKAQAEFTLWLQGAGLLEKPAARRARLTSFEREVNSILRSFPEFNFFGGIVRREVAVPDRVGEQRELGWEQLEAVVNGGEEGSGGHGGEGGNGGGEGPETAPSYEDKEVPTVAFGDGPNATPRLRLGKGGVGITFEDKPDLEKEAWFDGGNVCVNRCHPAYAKAEKKGMLEYHVMKSAILSVLEFDLEKDPVPDYHKAFDTVQRFFKLWGELA